MKHPYTKLREDFAISQTQLARVAGVSPQVVMRIEQGMYATPSTKVVSALVEAARERGQNLNSSILLAAHTDWVGHERQLDGPLIRHIAENWPYPGPVAAFCRILKVQLSVVQRWGFKGTMPPIVKEAFRDAGVSEDVLDRIS